MRPLGHSRFHKQKKRIFQIIEVGFVEDAVGRTYDIVNMMAIILNLIISVLMTFDELAEWMPAFVAIEAVTVLFFAVDYVLRVWTSSFLYPGQSRPKAAIRYIISFTGLIDLLSFLPYYLPVFFPVGAVAFRMFRVMRIFKLFRINAYYDSLHIITDVLKNKAQQLLSSVFVLIILMLASSLCMYSLEHAAQPDVFDNALSGIWWAASTLLTVGYGDIYPITTAGRMLGVVITFLGVGVVAIPTGIISAGFVEQFAILQNLHDRSNEHDIRFIRIELQSTDPWVGNAIRTLQIPNGMIIAAIERDNRIIVPRGDVVLQEGDLLVLAAAQVHGNLQITLKEIELKEQHEWCGLMIQELDISRQTFIIAVRRDDQALLPKGNLVLQAGDRIVLYTKSHLPDARAISI